MENRKTYYEVNVRPGEVGTLEARFNANSYEALEWSDLNALPHAEMVLVSHLWGSGTIERLAGRLPTEEAFAYQIGLNKFV